MRHIWCKERRATVIGAVVGFNRHQSQIKSSAGTAETEISAYTRDIDANESDTCIRQIKPTSTAAQLAECLLNVAIVGSRALKVATKAIEIQAASPTVS